MPKLYIANATQQVHVFTFWLPEATRPMRQEIPIGGQVLVANRELTTVALEGILKQHEVYGLLPVDEALKPRSRFYGLAYQADRPISLPRLQELVDRYRSILRTRGQQMRQEAAIATNDFIEQNLLENGIPGRIDKLEMSVEEVDRDARDESPEVSEGVRVVRGEDGGNRPPIRPRKKVVG